MKSKIMCVGIILLFILIAFLPINIIGKKLDTNEENLNSQPVIDKKYFIIKVKDMNGDPVEGATTYCHYGGLHSFRTTNSRGISSHRGVYFCSECNVQINAEYGPHEDQTIHEADVAGKVEITLSFNNLNIAKSKNQDALFDLIRSNSFLTRLLCFIK